MITRALSVVALLWLTGFALFMVTLPRALGGTTTDAIVVPTGGPGRIDRGLELLATHQARRMLVTGVAPGVRAADLARRYHVSPALFACCIDLGAQAVDTRSNAEETASWVSEHRFTSVRLVTSDWHVARARMELRAALGPHIVVIGDGVPGNARLASLVSEFNKLILRRIALWTGLG